MTTIYTLIDEFKIERDFNKIFSQMETDETILNQLIKVIVEFDHYPYPEYASWILTHYVGRFPDKIIPFQNQLIDVLFQTKNQTILRNVLNTLIDLDLTKYKESELMDLLIGFIQDNTNKVALQVYSIYYLLKFIKIYPEITTEIKAIIEMGNQNKSKAYIAAVRNFNKMTAKMK